MAYPLRPGGDSDIQDHDRIALESLSSEDEDVVVSLSQKMLSAISGSILTSILVTPLDVVRVRLQSQHSPLATTSTTFSQPSSSLTLNRTFSKLPPNLGISACCREVFWVNNNASYCVAGPGIAIVNHGPGIANAGVECAAEEAQKRAINSTWDGLKKIARNEGPQTLWRGLTPTLAMAVPGNVIYFAGYDWLRTSKASPLTKVGMNDNYAPLVAGSCARILAALVVSPIEMFRTRMQAASNVGSTTGHFRDTLKGLTDMVYSRGYRSLWTGLTLTLWRDVPFSALYWWGYETGRNVLTNMREERRGRERIRGRDKDAFKLRSRSRTRENHSATLVDSFIAGAASGAFAAFVTTPFDVGKTRQQVFKQAKETSSAAGKALQPEEQSMLRFLIHIYQEQGMQGLFKGWVPRVAKVAPACAIMISSYELGKKMAHASNERRDGDN